MNSTERGYEKTCLAFTPDAEMNDQKSTCEGPITKMVMRLFELWRLSPLQQTDLLGLSVSNRSELVRHRNGDPISSDGDQLERAGHILAIHQSLRLLFPENRELVYCWMTTHNKAFDNLLPVEVIQERGLAGMLIVRNYLDRAVGSDEFAASNVNDGKEQSPRASDRQVYCTNDLPQDLKDAIKAASAPPWTKTFNHEIKG